MRRLRFFLLLLLLSVTCRGDAATLKVGPTRTGGAGVGEYTQLCPAIEAATNTTADNGDTIEADAVDGTGAQIVYLAGCQYSKSLTIKGVGGPAGSRIALTQTSAGGGLYNQHGFLEPLAGYQRFENIEGYGATCTSGPLVCQPIWMGSTSIVRLILDNVYFHHNNHGFITLNQITTSDNRTIEVEIYRSEFAYNGIWSAEGDTHNVYIGLIKSIIFQDNYSHDAHNGQLLKTRAGWGKIINNVFVDSDSSGWVSGEGVANYEVDISDGGFYHVHGNIIRQGTNVPPPGRPNGNYHILVSCTECNKPGADAYANLIQKFYITHNTIINDRPGGSVFLRIYDSDELVIKNNIFAGSGDVYWDATAHQSDPAENSISSTTAGMSFVNAAGLDFRLQSGSAAENAAVSLGVLPAGGGDWSFNHSPSKQYAHPRSEIDRTAVGGTFDNGALERTLSGTAYLGPSRLETQNASGKVSLFWSDPLHENNPPSGFQIYRDATLVTTTAASAQTYDDTGGTPGQRYVYTVIPVGSPNGPVSNSVLAGSQRSPAASLGEGTGWHFIEDSNFALFGCTPSGSCPTYWAHHIAGAAWDDTDDRFFVWGGDYASRNKNAIYYFNVETGAWVKANADDTLPGGEYDATGQRPGQRYVYGGLSWADIVNKLFFHGGYFGVWSARSWEWTESGDTWDDYANGFDLSIDVASTAYRPSNGKIWVLTQDSNLREYDLGTHSYTTVKSSVSAVSYTRYLVNAESINKLFLVGQGYLGYFDLSNNYAQTSVTDVSCDVPNISSYPAVDFDSSTGKLVIWNKLSTVMLYDPGSNTCSSQTIVGEPDVGAGLPSNGFRFDSTRNVFWAIFNNNNVAALRLSLPGHTGGTLRLGAKLGNTP